MSLDEQHEHELEVAASEQPEVESEDSEQQEQKMVPLAALQAERKKRQEYEARAQRYEELMLRANQPQQQPEDEEEDPNALVEKKDLKQHLQETNAATKREILETLYQDMNPKAVQEINKYLKPILEKKPWLASSIDSALNRYARAHEIVEDYKHLLEEKPQMKMSNNDGRRIVQNANKPRSPVELGKSAQPSGAEFLKSIQGKKEFREYRQKVLRGEA